MATSKKSLPSPDQAKAHIADLYAGIRAPENLRTANEAHTRVVVIDRVLEYLGWPRVDIDLEVSSGAGDFLDYRLATDFDPWMVVEAKRADQTFHITGPSKASADSLTRPLRPLLTSSGASAREVLKQAAGYCNDRGVPLACATNGFQWIFFKGLSTRKSPWTDGTAIVFDGWEQVDVHFHEFWACLSREWAGRPYLLERLERKVVGPVPRPKMPRDFIKQSRGKRDEGLAARVRSIGDYLLGDIFGSQKEALLDRCYVEPTVAGDFERSVQRLLNDTERSLEDEPHPVLGGTTAKFAEVVERQDLISTSRQPVVVVGHVGAGKTTFLHKVISAWRSEHRAFCALVDLEGRGQGGSIDARTEENFVAQTALKKLGHAAMTVLKHTELSDGEKSQADPMAPDTLRTMMRDKLAQQKRLGEKVYSVDTGAWDRKELQLFEEFQADAVGHLQRFARHLSKRFKRGGGDANARYPVLLVFDNVDLGTDEYQKCIYGLAHRLARETEAVVVVCIREDTYAVARRPGGFLTSSVLSFVFHVASPPIDRLLRQRTQFGLHAADNGRLPAGLRNEANTVREICGTIKTALLVPKSQSLELVASLAGHNMRQGLELVRGIVQGQALLKVAPNPSAAFALDCVLLAIGHAELRARFQIANVFDAVPTSPPLHALRIRLLAYLAYAFERADERSLLESTDLVVSRFGGWGYPTSTVRESLQSLLADRQIRPTDWRRSVTDLPARVSITAAGYAHLTRLVSLRAYRAAMATVTRWYDTSLAEKFIASAEAAGSDAGPTIADIAESSAPEFFDAYLAHSVAREDAELVSNTEALPWVREVLARAAGLLPARDRVGEWVEARDSRRAPSDVDSGSEQVSLLLPAEPSSREVLPRITMDLAARGTVYVPRILWALLWAKINQTGPRSAAEIATILKRMGDLDVHKPNIARAFRECKANPETHGLWSVSGKRYQITHAGELLIRALLQEM